MKAKHFFLLALFLPSIVTVAQESDAQESIIKRFHLGMNFGTGHVSPYNFMGENIADNGYSTITAFEAIHVDLGYVINKRYSIIGGFGAQNMSLRYVYEDEAYRYNGTRAFIPLGFRLHLGPEDSPAEIIMGLGGYYATDSDDALLTDSGFEETDIFNGFGVWSTIGFSYAMTDDVGFSVTINSLNDFSANALRLSTGMISFGFYVRMF